MINYLKQYTSKTFEELVNGLIWFDLPFRLKAIFAKSVLPAPEDGNQYGMQDGEWAEIIAGSGIESVSGDSVDNTDPLNPIVNAIPLSGTTGGNPVTGDISFQGKRNLIQLPDEDGQKSGITFNNAGVIQITSEIYNGTDTVFVNQFYSSIYGYTVISTNPDAVGLIGASDFSANYTANAYVQKVYVIPLAGTEAGSPITGNLEIERDGNFKSVFDGDLGGDYRRIAFEDDSNILSLESKTGVNTGKISVTPNGIFVSSDDATSFGLAGLTDFSANYTSESFVQKSYVDGVLPQVADDFANDAAAALGGIVVGGLYHTAGVVKIRVS